MYDLVLCLVFGVYLVDMHLDSGFIYLHCFGILVYIPLNRNQIQIYRPAALDLFIYMAYSCYYYGLHDSIASRGYSDTLHIIIDTFAVVNAYIDPRYVI